MVRVSCIQLNSGDEMAANVARIQAFVAQAAGEGAQLIALPENAFLMEDPKGARSRIAQEGHPAITACVEMAREHGVWLLAGSIAVWEEAFEKCFNRSFLFDPQGSVVATYDKIHLFDVTLSGGESYRESDHMAAGDRAVLARTPLGVLGMSICYDLRFAHLYRALAKQGAQILAIPAAFTQITGEAHWHVLLRARAIESGCFVIAPAQTGTHPGGRRTYGHSLMIDPWGKIIAEAGTEEGIISAELDLGMVERVRAQLPSLSHDREFNS